MAVKKLDLSSSLKKTLKELSKKLETGKMLRAGFLEGATQNKDGKIVSIPMIAAIQNFGAPKVGIPPRPFFTNLVKKEQKNWGVLVGEKLIEYDFDAKEALRAVGEEIKYEIQQSITDTNEPPLSEVTLLLRQWRSERGGNFVVNGSIVQEAREAVANGVRAVNVSTKPLIDSPDGGHMQEAADFEVV